MTHIMTTKQESIWQRYLKLHGLMILLFLLKIGPVNAQKIVWDATSFTTRAENVNVGTNETTDIYFYFEVENGDITNGRIAVTLPYAEEAFNITNIQKVGGNIALPANPTVSGRTLTFNGVNLPQGSSVYYRIPRYVKTEANIIRTTGNVIIDVYTGPTGTAQPTNGRKANITYSYNYATLQFEDPSPLPTDQIAGMEMNFGDNNGVKTSNPTAQKFQFNISCTGGQTDSLTFTVKFLYGAATLSNWEVAGIPIPENQIVRTETTDDHIYTVKVRKTDIPGGKGLKPGDSLPIAVDVVKNNGGGLDVVYSCYWATQPVVKTAYTSNRTGSFNANLSDGKQPQLIGIPISWVNTGSTVCQNGNTEMVTLPVKNAGAGIARNIRMSCVSGFDNYIDTSVIQARIGKYGTPVKVKQITVTAKVSGPTFNPVYHGMPTSISVEILQHLNPNDTLYIDYGIRICADMRINTADVNFLDYYLAPHVSGLTYRYTDDNASITYTFNQGNNYLWGSTFHFGIISNDLGVSLFQNPEKYSHQIRIEPFNSTILTTNSAKITATVRLPKGIAISGSSDIKVYKTGSPSSLWPIENFQVDNTSNPDSVFYSFDLINSTRKSINDIKAHPVFTVDINLNNTCNPAENASGKFRISYDYYPTGTTGGNCSNVVYNAVQLYPAYSRLCVKEHVTFDFDFKRTSIIGLKDTGDDTFPDSETQASEIDGINLKEIIVGDTVELSWTGKVLENGDLNLYVVLLTELDQTHVSIMNNGIPKTLTLNGNTANIKSSPLNTTLAGDILKCYDRGTSVPESERYAYVWRISKSDGSPFSNEDTFEFVALMKATERNNGLAIINKKNMESWLYATTSTLTDIPTVLNPGNNRRGDEEYSVTYYYYAPSVVIATPAYSFSGSQQVDMFLNMPIFQTACVTAQMTPYEYRHLTTVDSIIVEVPEGYILSNVLPVVQITYSSSGAASTSNKVSITASSDGNFPNRKKFVFGSEVFDVNRNDPSKLPLADGNYLIRVADGFKLTSTNGSPTGTSNAIVTAYSDNHTYTQTNAPALGNSYTGNTKNPYVAQVFPVLQYFDIGNVKLAATGATTKPALSSPVSFDLALQNTKSDGDAYSAWLYVQGPVKNAVITIGGVDYKGVDQPGEDGRWISLPKITMGNAVPGVLYLEYENNQCSDKTVNLYTLFDRTATAQGQWTPADGGITMTDAGFIAAQQDINTLQYIGAPMKLTIQNVTNRIGGSITELASTPSDPSNPSSGTYGLSTIEVATEFPVEVVFDTNGGLGSVIKTKGIVTIPGGLEYVPNSAYITFEGVNYPVTGTMLNEFLKVDGTTGVKDLNLDLSTTGITALGNGELPGNTQTYLRFKLLPTCVISTIARQITLKVSGERSCGGEAGNSEVKTYYSDYLTLTGTQTSFEATATLSTTKTTMSCKTGETEQTITFKFRKTNKATIGVSNTDSIEIIMPAALDIKSTGVAFLYPALGNVSAQTGNLVPSKNEIVNGIRRITWPLPETYFNSLAAESNAALAECSYTFDIEFISSLATVQIPTGNISGAVLTSAKAGVSCPSIHSQIVIETANIEIVASPKADQPGNESVCIGETVPQIDFSGNFTDTGYGYSWIVTSATTGSSIGMSAESGTGTSIPAFVTTGAGTVTVALTPTYGDCTGTAKTFTITANSLPEFTVSKTSEIVCGTNVSVDLSTLIATGPTNGGVMKYYSNSACTSASELTSSTVTVTSDGTYYLRAENPVSGCKSEVQSIAISLKTPTLISTQPTETTSVCSGTAVNLTVAATGEGTLTYQWYDADGAISGATGTNYSPTTNGIYYVNVLGGCGTAVQSNNASVTFNPIPVPTITGASSASQGQSGMTYFTESGMSNYVWTISGGNITSGGTGSNTATVSWGTGTNGTITVTYKSPAGCLAAAPTSKNVSLNTQNVPVINLGTASDVCPNQVATYTTDDNKFNYNWSVVGGSIQSGQGTESITVIWDGNGASSVNVEYRHEDDLGLPLVDATEAITRKAATVITTAPSGGTVCFGQSHTMSVAVTCDGTASYVWKKDGAQVGGNTSTYTATESGIYTVEVTAGCGTAISAPANVTVKSKPVAALAGTTNVVVSQQVTYTAGTGSNYNWSVNGGTYVNGPGASEITVTWGSAGTGSVSVNYTDNGCPTTTETLNISIVAQGTPVIDNPVTSLCFNTTQVYSTTSGKYNYLWTVTGGTIDGNVNDQPTVSVTWGPAGTGTIKVAYSEVSSVTAVESPVTNVTINDKPTVGTISTPAGVCDGTALTLTTPTVTALPTITSSSWKLNGTAFTSGSTVIYAQNNAPLYYEATNECGTTVSNTVTITVKLTTAITTQPVAQPPIGLNTPFSLSVTAVGDNLTYQWYINNAAIPGATSNTYSVTSTTISDYGSYYVVVSGDCGTAQTSSTVTINGLSNDAGLKDLKVNGSTLSDFNPAKTNYSMTIACEHEQVTLLGIPNDAGATVSGNGTFALLPGENHFSITVLAQDQVTTMTYTVNVIRNCYVPKITKDLEDAVVCIGGSHSWSIEAEGENLTYEWYCGFNRIPGANTNTITINDAKLIDYERYYVIVRSNYNDFKSSVYSKRVKLWVANYLPDHLRFAEYPNPATAGKTYHIKVDGYSDVTKYVWSYSQEGVSFSPGIGKETENETWGTFGTLSVGTGSLKVTMDHPCGTREITQTLTVQLPTGVEDVTATTVTVYPNPTSGVVNVSNTQSNQKIRVLDTTGSLKASYPSQEGTTRIDLTGYAKGTYMIQYNGKTYKVIKK